MFLQQDHDGEYLDWCSSHFDLFEMTLDVLSGGTKTKDR